jgi:anti-sigma factor RsiW
MTEHPELHLSAYLDLALDPAERASVAAHLEGCARCRAQLADLRATSRLIGVLPSLVPGRSLVPRLDRAPAWLRPVRLLGAMGSGLFVFLFIASAVINSGSSLGGGTTTAERLAEKGQFGAAVNALASDSAKKVGDATAQPSAVPAAAAQATQTGTVRSDAVGSAAPTAAFAPAQDTGAIASATVTYQQQPQFGPPPPLFLTGAVLFAIAALLAHRRLHRT